MDRKRKQVLWLAMLMNFPFQCLALIMYRSYESVIVGQTPASNITEEQLLVVVQYVDKPLVNTTRFFVYRQNPKVIDIFPLSHLLRYD